MQRRDHVFETEHLARAERELVAVAPIGAGECLHRPSAQHVDVVGAQRAAEGFDERLPAAVDPCHRVVQGEGDPAVVGEGDVGGATAVAHAEEAQESLQGGVPRQTIERLLERDHVLFGDLDPAAERSQVRGGRALAHPDHALPVRVDGGLLAGKVAVELPAKRLGSHGQLVGPSLGLDVNQVPALREQRDRADLLAQSQHPEHVRQHAARLQAAREVEPRVELVPATAETGERAADVPGLLDERDAAAELSQEQGGRQAAGARTDHHVVVLNAGHGHSEPQVAMPPLTPMTWPWTYMACSEHRKSTTAATSSGVP